MNILKYSSATVITIPKEFKGSQFESILYPVRKTDHVFDKFSFLAPFPKKKEFRIHLLTIYDNSEED